MEISHNQQLQYAALALKLFDIDKQNIKNIENLLSTGELIKAHASYENGVVYDLTEYLYEQVRLLRKEAGAYDAQEFRDRIEQELES